jgi:hypothetical protein
MPNTDMPNYRTIPAHRPSTYHGQIATTRLRGFIYSHFLASSYISLYCAY